MPPKRTKVSGASASSSMGVGKFVNEDARKRYEMHKQSRQAIVERGLELHVKGFAVRSMIEKRRWGKFCEQPKAAVLPIVREFYANAAESRDSTVMVRGKIVCFDSMAINSLFELEAVDDMDFQNLVTYPDYDLVLDFLCSPGATWNKPNVYSCFMERSLTLDAAILYGFLTKKMMPVSHTVDVQKERAVVLYAILSDTPIDLGKLLFSQLIISIHNGHVGLFFPHIISDLCIRAGVEVQQDEEWLQPMKAIDDSYAQTKSAARLTKRPASALGESSSTRSQDHPPPLTVGPHVPTLPPQPRRHTLNDKVDELGAFVAYTNQFMAATGEYMRSTDGLLRVMSTHLGIDPACCPPPVAFPPPFQFQYEYPDPREHQPDVPPPDEYED